MTIYAVGDIQGMYEPLMRLLDKVDFDPACDNIWFTGDLVNRGPDSLKVLRYVKSLGDSAIAVLGNHDLHLIAAANGQKKLGGNHTLDEVLKAADRDELISWLRFRPLVHVEEKFVLVHAGLPPQWSVEKAELLAKEVEAVLRSDGYRDFLAHMYGDLPDLWDDALEGYNRLRFIVNATTRMRIVTDEGRLLPSFDGPPDEKPPGTFNWIDAPGRLSQTHTIICGHWAAQGFVSTKGMRALDSGCVWKQKLTLLSLDGDTVNTVECSGA